MIIFLVAALDKAGRFMTARPYLSAVLIALLALAGYIFIVRSAEGSFAVLKFHPRWNELGAIGDFFGGLLNPAFSLIVISLLVQSLDVQRRTLAESSEELRLSREVLETTREELEGSKTAAQQQVLNQKFTTDFSVCSNLLKDWQTNCDEFVSKFAKAQTKFRPDGGVNNYTHQSTLPATEATHILHSTSAWMSTVLYVIKDKDVDCRLAATYLYEPVQKTIEHLGKADIGHVQKDLKAAELKDTILEQAREAQKILTGDLVNAKNKAGRVQA